MRGWLHALVRGPVGPALLASGIFTFIAVQWSSSGDRGEPEPVFYSASGGLTAGEGENVVTKVVGSYESASVHHLRVAEGVRPHYHAAHDETVVVLSGRGRMTIGDETREVAAGTVLVMPRGTVHSLEVTGEALEAVSVFSPRFDGEDRVFVDSDDANP